MLKNIAQKGYIYVFPSSKIAFSKKFKNCILNQTFLINCLYLLVFNKIYLIEK